MRIARNSRVHEGQVIAVAEQERAFLFLDVAFLDGIGGAPAVLRLGAGADVAHFDGDESPALAGLNDLGLQDCPLLAIMFDNLPGRMRLALIFMGGPTLGKRTRDASRSAGR